MILASWNTIVKFSKKKMGNRKRKQEKILLKKSFIIFKSKLEKTRIFRQLTKNENERKTHF